MESAGAKLQEGVTHIVYDEVDAVSWLRPRKVSYFDESLVSKHGVGHVLSSRCVPSFRQGERPVGDHTSCPCLLTSAGIKGYTAHSPHKNHGVAHLITMALG